MEKKILTRLGLNFVSRPKRLLSTFSNLSSDRSALHADFAPDLFKERILAEVDQIRIAQEEAEAEARKPQPIFVVPEEQPAAPPGSDDTRPPDE